MKDCVKIVAVGDGAIGKTCLLIAYSQKAFPQGYVPTVFDNYDALEKYEGNTIKISLWDTAGQEEFDKLRPLSYPQTDVFLVCFSVVDSTSYENVTAKWVSEVRSGEPNAPIVLVGTKTDLREDKRTIQDVSKKRKRIITPILGEDLRKEIGAYSYVECSALMFEGVDEVFKQALKSVLGSKESDEQAKGSKGDKKSKGRCIIS